MTLRELGWRFMISARVSSREVKGRAFCDRKCDRKFASTFEDIPRAPQVPVVGSLPYFLRAGGQKQLHKYVDDLHRRLGPLFLDNLAGNKLIFISDPEANLQVYKSEGPFPQHFVLDAWTLFLKETGQKRGLFFQDGEEWLGNRRILNKILLHPKCMEDFVAQISSVCREFVQGWKTNPPKDQLEYQFYSWNIECIGEIIFGKRLGFLEKFKFADDRRNEVEDEFVRAIHDTFLESAKLYSIPARVAKALKLRSWKKFHFAVSKSLEIGNRYVETGIQDCTTEANETAKRSLLYKLLIEEKLTTDALKPLLIDLFLASADTTSHTASWALYLLGRNPEVAQKAREEIKSTLQVNKGSLSLETLESIKYLKAIIKEAMRMYPIATFLTRKLAKDTVLLNYLIPKETMVISSLYTMGRDPTNYSDPDKFRPERWLKNSNEKSSDIINRKAYVPWGIGARSCIGRKIAELELSLLIMESLLAFEWTVEEEIDIEMRMIAVPSKDIILNLKKFPKFSYP